MKKATFEDVEQFLKTCEESTLRFLELQLEFAKDVRYYQLKYGITNEEFALEYRCSVAHVEDLRKGSCELTMMDLANLRTIQAERHVKENARLKLASE